VGLGDGGVGSGLQGDLRYCVNTANANADLSNHIVFQPGLTGTIHLQLGRLMVTKNLAIDGPGAGLLTVSADGLSGVFEITTDPHAQDFRLSGVTVADGIGVFMGFDHQGGGLFNWHADVTLTDCVFTGNAVGDGQDVGQGGAIYTAAGNLVLNHCSLIDNHTDGPDGNRAGAIYVAGGTLTLNHCVISGNSSSEGVGAIFNNGVLTATDTTVSGNSGFRGGAIQDEYIMTWTHCTIADNVETGGGFGGGVDANGIDTFIDCTIADNQTVSVGGGFENGGVGQLTLIGSTISGNSAAMGGGGLWWGGGAVIATNSTFSGNSAANGAGGGILMFNSINLSSLELTSCTITQNSAAEAGGLEIGRPDIPTIVRNTILAGNQATDTAADVEGTVLSLGYNLVGAADTSTGWQASDLTGTSDNPLDPRLGPLQDNGGSTLTQAPFADSLAIDHGDPVESRSLDQRGTFRQFDGVPPDIGAVEAENAVAFHLLLPDHVTAGQAFALTVVALDQWGNTATTYAGTVHFDSTDLGAVLPNDYAFAAGDQGQQTFAVTLNTPGSQAIRVTDVNHPNLSDTATTVVDNSSAPVWDVGGWDLDGTGWHRHG
jgi:hypothetical protein